jgi:cell division protein FtsZ
MLFRTGLINLDFATLRQVFQSRGGKTLFSLGSGEGPEAVNQAIESLQKCPLLHTTEFSRKPDRLLVNIIGGTDLTLPMVNEIMTAITGQYGRDSHVIMGSVIDEGMQQRVEVSVLGTTDLGGRNPAPRRASPAARSIAPFPARDAGEKPEGQSPPPGAVAGQSTASFPTEGKTRPASSAQDEFAFDEMESRGHFDKTDRNLFEGQDLDVPTYLRKGIKITV